MPDGHTYTVPAGRKLRQRLADAPFEVFFDHGDATETQSIVAWWGDSYEAPQRPKQLAHLDIAIVDPVNDHVICLVEIEDSTHNPKTLIGDLVAPLLSNGIVIGQKADYSLDPSAVLLVFAHFRTEHEQQAYAKRLAHIQEGVRAIQTTLDNGGLTLRQCILDSFVDQDELNGRLWGHVEQALKSYYQTYHQA